MKIKIVSKNYKPYLQLEYKKEEWEQLKNLFEQIGLEIRETTNGFNTRQRFKFYREKDTEILKYIENTLRTNSPSLIDDINCDLLGSDFVNIGIFRVIPDENGIVEIKLHKYLTIEEVNYFCTRISQIYHILFSIVNNVEIEFRIITNNGNTNNGNNSK